MDIKSTFPEMIVDLIGDTRRAWDDAGLEIPEWLAVYSPEQQIRNERRLDRRLVEVRRGFSADRIPSDMAGRLEFLNRMELSLYRHGIPMDDLSPDHQQAFRHLSFEFVRQSLQFDPDLGWAEIKQAIRNIWIMGTIQFYLGIPIRLESPMLAYSLLYPYTDNYLDDGQRSADEKRRFCGMIDASIRGERVRVGESRLESGITALLDRINGSYPAADLPMVRLGLSAILNGQILSLEQQAKNTISDDDLLTITLAKGGSSVLADALLVDPGLQSDELRFFFGMGVFLQLIDDFQDMVKDEQQRHQTLFSNLGMTGCPNDLDGLVCRILHLIDNLTAVDIKEEDLSRRNSARMIRNQSIQLVMQTIAVHADRLSSSFIERMESCSSLRFEAIRRLKSEAVRLDHQKNDETFKKLNS
ncbi:MAG: hypothetical protein KBA26_12385 [Candidatus Delongbacteria bacterium]|nr:hypothetical protein [Candidatus Delongbacteria bacterium]